jgi:biofilm PGA synthesis N-glycosyltransferase PgaC
VIHYVSYFLLVLSMLFPLFHLVMVLVRPEKKLRINRSKPQQGMTILIPCYNEQSILQTTIEGLKRIDYTNYEIIFINDDSKDNTLKVLDILLDLGPSFIRYDNPIAHAEVRNFYKSKKYPNVFVIDKSNGGKADCLNAALVYANHDLVVTLDADTILDEEALLIVNQRFKERTIAGGGNVRILQGFSGTSNRFSFNLKHIIRFQIIEYMKGFGILKHSLSKVNALLVISGAFGIFNRRILIELGGYRKTVGEDIDITLKFQDYISRNPTYKMIYIPQAICYTECPESWGDLYKQRIRWQKAFVDCIIRYRKTLLKSVFSRPVSFFMVFDALIVGTLTSYIAMAYIITLLFVPNSPITVVLIFYSLTINFLWDLFAIIKAIKNGQRYKFKDTFRIAVTIILELTVFNLIRCFYVMVGTGLYFFNQNDWNKVTRTGALYHIETNSPKQVGLITKT